MFLKLYTNSVMQIEFAKNKHCVIGVYIASEIYVPKYQTSITINPYTVIKQ